jgi:peroxiredoxin
MKNSFLAFICFLALVVSHPAIGGNVTVKGVAEAYKGNEIELFIYADYLSLREKTLAKGTIGPDGNFSLNVNLENTARAYLKIENIAASIYLEPEKEYSVKIPALAPGKEIQGNLNYIGLEFLGNNPKNLNLQIEAFNKRYDKFIEDNYSLIVTKAAKPKVEEFKKSIEKSFSSNTNQFLKQYMFYSLASLSQLASSSKPNLYRQYLKDKPVLYDNPEYMAFFKEFYQNRFLMLSQKQAGASLTELVNTKKDYTALMEFLKKDSLLADPQVRELVLLKGLQENYGTNQFNAKSIIFILKQVAQHSVYSQHKVIAENLIYTLTRFEPGKKAPDFELQDVNGQKVSLEQFKGKYVYLSFWATWCTSCVNDMRLLKAMKEKYQNNIVFISISTDKKTSDFQSFVKKNNFDWPILHYSAQKKVVEDYEARGLPVYYLISPDGRFVEAPAPAPSGNVEKRFHDLTKQPEKKHRVGSY